MKKSPNYVLGISAFYHDSAACLLCDGEIVCAIAEERLSRKKHDSSLPILAVKYCLEKANISIDAVHKIVFYEKPFVKFERVLETFVKEAPFAFLPFQKAIKSWLKEKIWIPHLIRKELHFSGQLLFAKHHESHAASACFTAPFNQGAFLVMDAVGEQETSSFGVFNNGKLTTLQAQYFPHSLGMLYSAFTAYCGFKVNSGEYKLMGLAPYGKPIYTDLIRDNLVTISNNGSLELNMKFFQFHRGLKMYSTQFEKLMGEPARIAETEITPFYANVAASIQKITEEIIVAQAQHVKAITQQNNLCLAGGVALNCVANSVLSNAKIFDSIWIQPAAGDDGGALGAALLGSRFQQEHDHNNTMFSQPYWGKTYSADAIEKALSHFQLPFKKYPFNELTSTVAHWLKEQKTVGWFQDAAEWGPRALGNRSILASPVKAEMQKKLNLQVKKREDFRPFAPVILAEEVEHWFYTVGNHAYMQFTVQCKQPEKVAACVHQDGSSRVQTVTQNQNSKLYNLLQKVKEVTEIPVLINTSFNQRGEPIVETPKDAILCFLATDLDVLVLDHFVVVKEEIDSLPHVNSTYEMD